MKARKNRSIQLKKSSAQTDKADKKLLKQASIVILKVGISGALLYLLVSRVGGRTIVHSIGLLHPAAFLAALSLYVIAAYFSTLRWRLLIPFHIRTPRLFNIYMIGSFFNTYMPGIIGGDAVKAYYLQRELLSSAGQDKGEKISLVPIIASVFMDRYIGLGALIALGLVVFPFGAAHLRNASVNWPVIWVIPTAAFVFVCSSVILFKFRLGERFKFLVNTYQHLHFYSARKKIVMQAFLYSLLVQFLGILAVYVIAKGMSLDISFLLLVIFLPIIVLVTALPLSVSGIGLREGAFIVLLGSAGIPPEKCVAVSIIWFLSVFAAGLWGLVEYLRFKTLFRGDEKEEPFQVP